MTISAREMATNQLFEEESPYKPDCYTFRMLSRKLLINWLQIVIVIVFIYSLTLVFAGATAGQLFSIFGFGPDDSINSQEFRDYLLLPYMVLGAVMAGWTFMMLQIVRGPLREGIPWARTFMLSSLTLWFILDTGMSLVLAYPTHAIFNIPFALALGLPLYLLGKKTLK